MINPNNHLKEAKKHIELKFNCQENPESMVNTNQGEFCKSCQKEVIDFTNMSYSQIKKIRSSQSEMCGKFRPDQVDPTLRPVKIPRVRSYAFLSTILVSLNFGNVSAQSTVDPKVEQSQGSSNAPNLTPKEAKEKSESGQRISMSKAEVPVVQKTSEIRISQSKRDRMIKRRKRKLHKKLF